MIVIISLWACSVLRTAPGANTDAVGPTYTSFSKHTKVNRCYEKHFLLWKAGEFRWHLKD